MILQKYDFSSKSQHNSINVTLHPVVCDTAKVRFFKQITTFDRGSYRQGSLFVILQKYDFSSKSQHDGFPPFQCGGCLWYCKSTIFQANHNCCPHAALLLAVVCDTAKVRFFKQITTNTNNSGLLRRLFVILQKYDFSSKSQLTCARSVLRVCCLWYCKSTIFQANHNPFFVAYTLAWAVCDTAKVRFFKQITTLFGFWCRTTRCLWYCKSTIFQANHNRIYNLPVPILAVCDTAKVRFFKQITT